MLNLNKIIYTVFIYNFVFKAMSLFMSDMICKWFTDGYWYIRGVGVAGGLTLEYGIGCATFI